MLPADLLQVLNKNSVPESILTYMCRILQLQSLKSKWDKIFCFVGPTYTKHLKCPTLPKFQATMEHIKMHTYALTFLIFEIAGNPSHCFLLLLDWNNKKFSYFDSIYGNERFDQHNITAICTGLFNFAGITNGIINTVDCATHGRIEDAGLYLYYYIRKICEFFNQHKHSDVDNMPAITPEEVERQRKLISDACTNSAIKHTINVLTSRDTHHVEVQHSFQLLIVTMD